MFIAFVMLGRPTAPCRTPGSTSITRTANSLANQEDKTSA
jgi:hypothetical protein